MDRYIIVPEQELVTNLANCYQRMVGHIVHSIRSVHNVTPLRWQVSGQDTDPEWMDCLWAGIL